MKKSHAVAIAAAAMLAKAQVSTLIVKHGEETHTFPLFTLGDTYMDYPSIATVSQGSLGRGALDQQQRYIKPHQRPRKKRRRRYG